MKFYDSMLKNWRHLLLALFSVVCVIFLYWYIIQSTSNIFLFQHTQSGPPLKLQSSLLPSGNQPLILVWTRIFGQQSMRLNTDCPLHDKCVLTYDHATKSHADAIVYHIPDMQWLSNETQDFAAYKNSGVHNNMKQQRVNVFLSQENPSSLNIYYKSKKLGRKLPNFFHWMMTYLHNSHVPMPYGGYWLSPEQTKQHGFSPVQLPYDQKTILNGKFEKGILWMVSNCKTSSKREVAIQALSKYIPVTIGGKCAKTPEGKQLCPRDAKNGCDHLYARYHFYISAENDICRDYVTEKYWSRYMLPAVPIVMRKWVYERIVPTDSFIAMDQFASPKEMADYLHLLMKNPDAYMKHFQWRSQNWSIAPWNHEGFRIGICALCEQLLNLRNGNQAKAIAPIPDAVKWFEQESKCEGGEFAEQWANKTN